VAINAALEILKADIKNHIQWKSANRVDDKRKSMLVAVYVGAVSAVTTVSIGLGSLLPEYKSLFGIVSLLTSASLTVVSAWDGMFHHKKLWVSNVRTLSDLYELESDVRHAESTNCTSQPEVNEFYQRFKKILRENSDHWQKIRE
jgi:hypothetical protein